jgi:hypothetical protein
VLAAGALLFEPLPRSFAIGIFQIESHIHAWPGPSIYAFLIAGLAGMHYDALILLVEMESLRTSCPAGLWSSLDYRHEPLYLASLDFHSFPALAWFLSILQICISPNN